MQDAEMRTSVQNITASKMEQAEGTPEKYIFIYNHFTIIPLSIIFTFTYFHQDLWKPFWGPWPMEHPGPNLPWAPRANVPRGPKGEKLKKK
eukprot:5616540-Karenia_brevis.AAC.1